MGVRVWEWGVARGKQINIMGGGSGSFLNRGQGKYIGHNNFTMRTILGAMSTPQEEYRYYEVAWV